MSAGIARAPGRENDWVLTLCALALVGLGTVLVMSATWRYADHPSIATNGWLMRHGAFLFLGLVGMVVCGALQPRILRTFALPLYAGSVLALLAVALVGKGTAEYGAYAQRWLEVGPVSVQPSEPAKLALMLALARVLSGGTPGLRPLLLSAALTAVPAALVYLQPDLGTALTLIVIWVGMLVLAGTPKRYIAAIGGLVVLSLPILWLTMREYMRQRILTFLNPEAFALTEGYNMLQAQISIGSGGIWGKGLLEGTQTQLRYLRLSHSDFIFAVVGEELGFVGAIVLLALFLLLLLRILRAYERADTRFAALVCAGVASMIAFQVVANIGGNVGITPVAGFPLPLVSHGGSSLVTQLAALGLVQASLTRPPYLRPRS